MSNIHIFYHVGQINNWEFIVQEQLHALQISGLMSVCDGFHVGVSGNLPIQGLPSKAKVTHHPSDLWTEEKGTIRMIKDFCTDHGKGSKILYLHTKGVTWNKPSVNCWRLYMEYFCVHKWRTCIADLQDHDCVGPLWATATSNYPSHFSGNFWWANSQYITDKVNHNLIETNSRFDREFWIGSGTPNAKGYGIKNAPVLGDYFFENVFSSETICEDMQ
jgi:hypothetical protein